MAREIESATAADCKQTAKTKSHRIDLTGQRFGRWLVIEFICRSSSRSAIWKCRCDCGNTSQCASADLRRGSTKSCGCLCGEINAKRVTKHGAWNHSEYHIWAGMIKRCCDPNAKDYMAYGGRGITVCDRWKESPASFFDDMGPRPTKSHSINRIDNNAGYSKQNCEWTTAVEQANNRTSSRFIEAFGKCQTVAQWSRETGIHPATISSRLKSGLSGEDCLRRKPE